MQLASLASLLPRRAPRKSNRNYSPHYWPPWPKTLYLTDRADANRLRSPLEILHRIRHAVADRADKLLPQAQQLWHGLFPKVIDGTTITLPDTPANQRAYPQSRSQKPGCGFPLMKLVGIFSLSSGV